jgi:SAM-dependent methyltransferase
MDDAGTHRVLFDDQAGEFDRRAGLPSGVPEKIALALADSAELRGDRSLVEIGAGTGEIGVHLARLPGRYLGLDRSFPMLRAFRARKGFPAFLMQADGCEAWPLRSGSIDVVFGSRSLHYIPSAHFASELERVCASKRSLLYSGGLQREKESVKETMSHRMRHTLRERGFRGHGGGGVRKAMRRELERWGWTRMEPRTVSSWEVASSPLQSLEAWQGKAGLNGLDVPADVKQSVLEDVRQWAEAFFGSLSRQVESAESYVLEGMVRGS